MTVPLVLSDTGLGAILEMESVVALMNSERSVTGDDCGDFSFLVKH